MLRQITKTLNEKVLCHFDAQLVRRSALPAKHKSTHSDDHQRRRIIFFHPPKCGGTSVETWMGHELGGGGQLANGPSRQAAEALDMPMSRVREVLLAYELRRSENLFVSGHYLFSERAVKGVSNVFDMITILREPKARLLSQYYFNRFKEDREHFGIEMELREWLNTSQAKSAASLFVKMFSGDAGLGDGVAQDGTQAIRNLRRFSIVGILEKKHDFERQVKERYKLKGKLKHLRMSPAKDYPKFEDQPDDIKERIEDICAIDSRIYKEFS